MVQLFDFAVMTIFAREFLEGGIIVVEYRAIIRYGGPEALRPGLTQARALREVTLSTLFATALALLVVAAVAIPLAVLSMSFDDSVSELIEGISKLVAAVSILLLSLKLPKFLGVGPYATLRQPTTTKEEEVAAAASADEEEVQPRTSQKRFWFQRRRGRSRVSEGEEERVVSNGAAAPMEVPPSENDPEGENDVIASSSRVLALPSSVATSSHPLAVPDGGGDAAMSGDDIGDTPTASNDNNNNNGLTVRAIRFNVAWNLWREVAECGVFLIPFFLTGDGVAAIPLSAVSGAVVGIAVAGAIAIANRRCKNRSGLAVLVATLVAFLSGGLFTDSIHTFEERWGETPTVYTIPGEGWSQYRLPLTLLKPFGYSASRTVLQFVGFWLWMGGTALLHWLLLRRAKARRDAAIVVAAAADPKTDGDRLRRPPSSAASSVDADTAEAGESSLEEGGILPLKKGPGPEAASDGLSQCGSTAVETEESSSTLSPSPPPSGVPGVVEAPLRRGADETGNDDADMDECFTLDRVVGGLCGGRSEAPPRGSGDAPLSFDGPDAEADEEGTV